MFGHRHFGTLALWQPPSITSIDRIDATPLACCRCVSHICYDLIFTRFSIGSHQVFSESQYWLRFSAKVSSSFQKFATIRNLYWPVSYCIVLVLDSNTAKPLAFWSLCWSLFLFMMSHVRGYNHKQPSKLPLEGKLTTIDCRVWKSPKRKNKTLLMLNACPDLSFPQSIVGFMNFSILYCICGSIKY